MSATELQTKYLYALSAYSAIHALLFTLKPEIPTADTFGEEEAKSNEPVKLMTSVMGSLFGAIGLRYIIII